jgi:hypothetical protein
MLIISTLITQNFTSYLHLNSKKSLNKTSRLSKELRTFELENKTLETWYKITFLFNT